MTGFDAGHAFFQFGASILVWANYRSLAVDREVKGVDWRVSVFFLMWALWNVFYFSSAGNWASFFGAVVFAIAQGAWLVLYWRIQLQKSSRKTTLTTTE